MKREQFWHEAQKAKMPGLQAAHGRKLHSGMSLHVRTLQWKNGLWVYNKKRSPLDTRLRLRVVVIMMLLKNI